MILFNQNLSLKFVHINLKFNVIIYILILIIIKFVDIVMLTL